MNLIHLNHHQNVDSGVPFFALVDAELQPRLCDFRWITTSESSRPFRVQYCKEKGRPVTESLARHVWSLTRGTTPKVLGHVNGDLLDCRLSNLEEVASKKACRAANTGKTFQPPSARDYRINNRLNLEGGKKEGRPLPCTPEVIERLRALRADVCADMPMKAFNNEVIREEIGKPLSWRLIKKIFS